MAGRKPSVIWSPELLTYRHSADHPMDPRRLELTMSLARAVGIVVDQELIAPTRASDAEILRVHSARYLAAVTAAGEEAARPGAYLGPPLRSLGSELAGVDAVNPNLSVSNPAVPTGSAAITDETWQRHGLGTLDNPIFPRIHESSALIVGGTLAAAQRIAAGESARAVSIAGGMHHAMNSAAAGFCVYNDPAVAISWLLDNGFSRIAYVDVDAHHGDGVQKAFIDDPRVLTISIHQHPATLWPNTGWPAEVGYAAAEGTAVNLPLLPLTDDSMWLRAFHAVVPSVLRNFAPEILVSQCGVDSHRDDPLADLCLTVDGHREIFRTLSIMADELCQGRWLAVGGGGYGISHVVPRSWTHLLAAVLDVPLAATTPIPTEWRETVGKRMGTVIPETMSDLGEPITYDPWEGGMGEVTGPPSRDRDRARVDSAILETRRSVFPLLGLDPDDPRD